MSVLVFVEQSGGKIKKSSFEAVYYAAKIAAGNSAVAVVLGEAENDELAKIGNYGVEKVLHVADAKLNNFDTSTYANVIQQVAEKEGADTLVFSANYTGKALAPYLSVKLKAGLVSGAVDFPDAAGNVKKSVYSGKAFANYSINSDKKIISVLPNSLSMEAGDGKANVETFSANIPDSKVTVKEQKKAGDKVPLTEAELVVSGGRGLKGPENWGLIEDLAEALGASTACSRPVSDMDWRPHNEHVGQTGLAIRPNLYIAVGISGAIQHLAGVNGSKVIVVINKDPEAPFFKAADYGIVGDAFEVLPKLTEAVKNLA